MQMPFGKYRNWEISEIPSDYLEWLLDNIEDLRPRLRSAIEDALGMRNGSRSHSNGFNAYTASATGTIVVEKGHASMVAEIFEAGYKTVARKYHPDAGGDTAKMQTLNNAVESIRKQLKGL